MSSMFRRIGIRLAIVNALVVLLIAAVVALGTALAVRQALAWEDLRILKERAGAAAVAWAGDFPEVGATAAPVRTVAPLKPPSTPTPTATPDGSAREATVGAIATWTAAANDAVATEAMTTAVATSDAEAADAAATGAAAGAAEMATRRADPDATVAPAGDNDGDTDEQIVAVAAVTTGDILLYGIDLDGDVVINDRGFLLRGLPNLPSANVAGLGAIDDRLVTIDGLPMRIVSVPVWSKGKVVGVVQAARSQAVHEKEVQAIALASAGGILVAALIAPIAGIVLSRRSMRPIALAFGQQRAFVSDASHELRTPLTVLRANAELMQRLAGAPPEMLREDLAGMIEEIDGMSRLVDELLFLARSDDERGLTMDMQPLDLAPVIEAMVDTHRERAEQAGLTLTALIAGPLPVRGDGGRLRQTLGILLDNAVLYTPSGGSVAVEGTSEGTHVVVRVRDTGIGISPEDQQRVFDRFYRADKARTRRTGGTGLGLSIAQVIVERHHGTIGVESTPGSGSVFTIRLPLDRGR